MATYTETQLYDDLRKTYYNEYEKHLNIPNFTNLTTSFSQLERFIQNYQMIIGLSLYNKIHYITTTFKISASKTTCVYGYLFSELNETDFEEQTFLHSYYIYGSTYTSQDGEFRSKFLPYSVMDKLKGFYPNLLEIVEQYVIELMNEKQIELYCDIYYPTDIVINEGRYRSEVNGTRMAIKLFMMCFITDYLFIMDGTQPNHMYPAYDKIFHDLLHGESVIKELRKAITSMDTSPKINATTDKKMSLFIQHCKSPKVLTDSNPLQLNKLTSAQIGIKFIPLTIQDAQSSGNIICDTWREYYISRRLSELTLNLIAPNFALVTSWFVVQNSNSALFDGFSMNQKYNYSKLSEQLIKSINDDRQTLRVKDEKGKPLDSNVYLNPQFKELADRLLKDIVYVNAHIRLSDITLCNTSEYIGRTFLDIDKLLKMQEYYQLHDMFTNVEVFDGLLFGLMYGLYAMNARMSVSHNDLHLNNLTLYKYMNIKSSVNDSLNLPMIKNAKTLYYVNHKYYAVKNVGFFIGIIDFSRALIGDHDVIKQFDELTYRQALKDQRIRYMGILERKFPKLLKDKKDELESLLLSNLPLMFKILSGLDIFDVCIRVLTLFKNIIKTYDDKIVKGLTGLAMRAEKLVLKHLESALKGPMKASDIEFPNYELLHETYSKYMINMNDDYKAKIISYQRMADFPKDVNKLYKPIPDDKIVIADAFNFHNEIKYSNVTNKMPPWIDFTLEENLRKEKNIVEDPYIKKYNEFQKRPPENDPFEVLIRKYENEWSEVGNSTSWLV
jgi:hypothetical protein